jgi:ascorbate-specific PTS system EIIC-type component UlaA
VPAVIAAASVWGWSITAFLLGFLLCFVAFVRGWL